MSVELRCDMHKDCEYPVTMIDDKGYGYCTNHGLARQGWRPCRKLRPHELNKLKRGEQLSHY